MVETKYKTIVIDPPFEISLTGKTSIRPLRRSEIPYKTMTLEEIKEFPVKDFAETGCHVYLWINNKYLRHTWEIFDSWGVNFHLMITWIKPAGIAPNPKGYQFACEFLALGFFGKPMLQFTGKTLRNWLKVVTQKDAHSTKPDEFYELIKEKSPEPRIDIFARKRHDGFDAYGDQVERFLQKTMTNMEYIQ